MKDRTSTLGRRIAEARRAAGLSPAGLAERLGVSRVTVRELEMGRDSRHSALARVLDALPALAPTDLLGGLGRPPSALHAGWEFEARMLGARAARARRRVVIEDGVVEATTRLDGLRLVPRAVLDADGLALLLRLVLPAALQREAARLAADLAGSRAAVEATSHATRHALRIERDGSLSVHVEEPARRVDADAHAAHACGAAGALALGSAWLAPLPVRRVEIELRRARAGRPVPASYAWWTPTRPSEDMPPVEPGPGVSCVVRDDGTSRLAHEWALPGLHLALGWRPAAAATRRAPRAARLARRAGAPVPAEPLAAAIRRARLASGLTLRDLAERTGVGTMTLSDAERGSDPRASTLQACVAALPALSPWDVLAPARLSTVQAWALRRDLVGCEAASETKVVAIDARGDAAIRIETRELRLVAPRSAPLRVLVGLSAPSILPTRARLESVDTSRDGSQSLRITAATGPGGESAHQLTVPEALARHGVSFTRVLQHAGVYALREKEARRRTGRAGPFQEGTSFAAVLPVRTLRIVVRFPAGAWPGDFTTHAWALAQVPDPARPGIETWLHPDGIGLEVRARSRTAVVEIDRPVTGARYALSWTIQG